MENVESKSASRLIDALHAGEWVYGINDEVGAMLRRVESLCHKLNLLPPDEIAARQELIRDIIGKVGENCLIHSPFRCDFGSAISIGSDFVANYGLTILDEATVTIGDRVFIGPNVNIYTVVHAMLPEQRAAGVMKALPVHIDDDVWIGGNVTILPGVTIGRGAVIGAGSVVAKPVPPMTLAFGVPARPIRPITDSDYVDL